MLEFVSAEWVQCVYTSLWVDEDEFYELDEDEFEEIDEFWVCFDMCPDLW